MGIYIDVEFIEGLVGLKHRKSEEIIDEFAFRYEVLPALSVTIFEITIS